MNNCDLWRGTHTRESESDGGGETKGFENHEFVVKRHDDSHCVCLDQRLQKRSGCDGRIAVVCA